MIETGGRKTVYSYDDLNRLVKAEIFSSASDAVAAKTVDYSYNKVGTLTGYNDGTTSAFYGYDDLQRRISATVDYGSFDLAHSYTWYGNGMKKSYTDPAGRVRSWNYDSGGRATGLKLGVDGGTGINSAAGEVSTNSFIWNSPSKITLPGGSTLNYGYNGLQELTSVITKDPGENPVIDYGYNYSLGGQVKSKSTEHGNYSYDYDEVNRLTSVTGSAPAEPESYSYDALGNRLSSVGDSDWDYDANNQLLARNNASYSYNIHGSMTEKDVGGVITNYSYTADNRLLTVESSGTTIASYYYDPFGRRLWKDVDGTRTNFHYNDEGLTGEYDSAGTELRTYGYYHSSSWTTNPLFIQQNGEYYWYQNDHLGTPQKIIAGNGEVVWSARYDSFGRAEIDTATIANNLRFPGQYFDDETVLHYNWNRYYDPDLGRYVTADPIGLDGGINFYGYVVGDPVNLFDPMGLAKYNMFFDTAGLGAGPFNYMEVQGWLVSLEKGDECSRCPGSYESIKFKGRLGGAGFSIAPVASTRDNQEIFEDNSAKPNVMNVGGVSSILAGTAVLSNNTQSGFSGGMYNFGYMAGTNKNIATTEGYDLGIDAVIGYTQTVGNVVCKLNPNKYSPIVLPKK